MIGKRKLLDYVFDFINTILMILLGIITLYPFIYIAFGSISDSTAMMMHRGLLLWPVGKVNFESYTRVFQNPMILRGYVNTLFYVVVGGGVNFFLTTLGAFVLSRKNLYWKKYIMMFCLFTMFVNGGLIPFYLLVKGLGLINSVWAVILGYAIDTWYLIIMRTYFLTIPDSLEESAKIDGANEILILFKIIIPVSIPIIAVIILFYCVDRWNAWFSAMLFLKDREKYPFQLILREILIINSGASMQKGISMDNKLSVSETIKYSTIMIATVPILFVYPFLQKYFVQGVMVGAIKE
jgi:putative aldouronate transport system permease protein